LHGHASLSQSVELLAFFFTVSPGHVLVEEECTEFCPCDFIFTMKCLGVSPPPTCSAGKTTSRNAYPKVKWNPKIDELITHQIEPSVSVIRAIHTFEEFNVQGIEIPSIGKVERILSGSVVHLNLVCV
jgi:hypothetical protein